MPTIPNLPRVIDTLARIDDAGMMQDFEIEVAEATRGPADDLDRYPQHKFNVGKFARLASRIFALPISECQAAACEALLPTTRRGIALQILEEFEERLDQQIAARFASRTTRQGARRA